MNETKPMEKREVLEKLLQDPDLLINVLQELKTEREARKKLENEISIKNQMIGELKPKTDYIDLILKSEEVVGIHKIAKDYGMNARQMNEILCDLGVQCNQDGQWLICPQYSSKGYVCYSPNSIAHLDAKTETRLCARWTQKGKLFLYGLLKAYGIIPMIERDKARGHNSISNTPIEFMKLIKAMQDDNEDC